MPHDVAAAFYAPPLAPLHAALAGAWAGGGARSAGDDGEMSALLDAVWFVTTAARAEGLSVVAVLRALDDLAQPVVGAGPSGADPVRRAAGTAAIAAYHRRR